MKTYNQLLVEANVKKLKHLEHIMDGVLLMGFEGARESIEILRDIRDTLRGEENDDLTLSLKWDGCIHSDTLIETSEGPVKVSEVVQNPTKYQIMTYNTATETNEYSPVVGTSVSLPVKEWIQITLENGETVKLTEDHEVYVVERGWVKAKDLEEGDDIKEM